jgi:hypothetical protein
MLKIEIKNLDGALKSLQKVPEHLNHTKKKASTFFGNVVRDDIRKYIESSGDSSWHPPDLLRNEPHMRHW